MQFSGLRRRPLQVSVNSCQNYLCMIYSMEARRNRDLALYVLSALFMCLVLLNLIIPSVIVICIPSTFQNFFCHTSITCFFFWPGLEMLRTDENRTSSLNSVPETNQMGLHSITCVNLHTSTFYGNSHPFHSGKLLGNSVLPKLVAT